MATPSTNNQLDKDFRDPPFWRRRPAVTLCIGLCFACAAAYVGMRPTSEKVKVAKVEEHQIPVIPLIIPPQPKIEPPKVEPPKQQEIVEQPKLVETEPPVIAPVPSPPTFIAPPGPGGILPGGSGHKGTGTIGGGKKRGKFDGFVISTHKALVSALKGNAATKTAAMKCEASLWSDSTGRVTKAVLKNVSGDTKIAQTLDSSILVGFQLPEAPPVGMPMPINMRISIDRPN